MIPTLTPAQAAWLDENAGAGARALGPEDAARLDAQRGFLVHRGGTSVLVAQDLQGRWILGGRPLGVQSAWQRDRAFPRVDPSLWPAPDHAVLLSPQADLPAHQRLAAQALAEALGQVGATPWPSLVAVGSPKALLLLGVPVAEATGFLLGLPPHQSPLPPLLAVLPPP